MAEVAIDVKTDEYILHHKVTPIEDSYNKDEEYKSVVERYYTIRYELGIGGEFSDYAVLFHSNRLCVITLATSHFLITGGKTIVGTDFQVSNQTNRLNNEVRGKFKRGAQMVAKPSNVLFYVSCSDGTKAEIHGCIPGKIVEINQQLIDDPNLMIRDPFGKGYIAIIQPLPKDFKNLKETMATSNKIECAPLSDA